MNVNDRYRRLLAENVNGYGEDMEELFEDASDELDQIAESIPDKDFHFSEHGRRALEVAAILLALRKALCRMITEAMGKSWSIGNMWGDAVNDSVGWESEDVPFQEEYDGLEESMDSVTERFLQEKEENITLERGGDDIIEIGDFKSVKKAVSVMADESYVSFLDASTAKFIDNPFVVGFEVRRSKKHPYDCPLCDQLKGVYPKDFKFTPWHPHCRCEKVPIFCTDEEAEELKERKARGEDISNFHSKNEVTKPHDGFDTWINDNRERIQQARKRKKYIPDWIESNPKYAKRTRDTMRMAGFNLVREFGNGGKIYIHELVETNRSDYDKLVQIAEHFAREGKEVRLTPRTRRSPVFNYEDIYGSLTGTKFENKCPDLLIDDLWYEHEGYITADPKNAFRNMMHDGLIQSNRLIIDQPGLTDRYMRKSIYKRINEGVDIKELWISEINGVIRRLY